MVTGEVCCSFAQPQTVLGQCRAGKVRLLGVSTKTRIGILADVPTVDGGGAAGLRERHLVRPDRTQGARRQDRRAHQRRRAQGTGEPRAARQARRHRHSVRSETLEQFRATVKADRAKWAEIVKASGAKID